jgi:hypothetical protein
MALKAGLASMSALGFPAFIPPGLRLAAVGGGRPRARQPRTGPASDAARRPDGNLPATEQQQALAHKIYPYRLGGVSIERVNQSLPAASLDASRGLAISMAFCRRP